MVCVSELLQGYLLIVCKTIVLIKLEEEGL